MEMHTQPLIRTFVTFVGEKYKNKRKMQKMYVLNNKRLLIHTKNVYYFIAFLPVTTTHLTLLCTQKKQHLHQCARPFTGIQLPYLFLASNTQSILTRIARSILCTYVCIYISVTRSNDLYAPLPLLVTQHSIRRLSCVQALRKIACQQDRHVLHAPLYISSHFVNEFYQ